jgi:hypothetical protein
LSGIARSGIASWRRRPRTVITGSHAGAMRILRAVLLLPVALASLVGCSPADEPLTALAIRDGMPAVIKN